MRVSNDGKPEEFAENKAGSSDLDDLVREIEEMFAKPEEELTPQKIEDMLKELDER